VADNYTSTSGTVITPPSGDDVLTELGAINTMLSVIGETEVTSIDLTLPDVAMAKAILDSANRDVQTVGLNSNSDRGIKLAPSTGEFFVPTSPYPVLRIDASNKWTNVVRRGAKLYDKDNNTFTFTLTELRVDIVWFLPFGDLPVATRVYITMKAAKCFQARVLGSEILGPYTKDDEFVAWSLFHSEELNTGNYTMLNSPGLCNLRRR
jgi:hypothetical protein